MCERLQGGVKGEIKKSATEEGGRCKKKKRGLK